MRQETLADASRVAPVTVDLGAVEGFARNLAIVASEWLRWAASRPAKTEKTWPYYVGRRLSK